MSFGQFAFIIPIVLGLVMMGAGVANVAGPASIRESFARWGYPAGFHRITGALEIAAGVLLLIPATARLGAIGTALILAAAIVTLIRFRDWSHLPGAAILTAVAAAVVFTG